MTLSNPHWVPDRAEYCTVKRTEGGQGLEIQFYRPQDLPPPRVGGWAPRVWNVSELPELLRKVDAVRREPILEIRAQLELVIKRIDEHA